MARLTDLFSSSAETGEQPKQAKLKTRYYRNDQKQIVDAVESIGKQLSGFKLIHKNQSETEITFMNRSGPFTLDVVVTVFRITPIQFAIDIYSASRSRLPDFGASEKTILKIYDYLDSKLTRTAH